MRGRTLVIAGVLAIASSGCDRESTSPTGGATAQVGTGAEKAADNPTPLPKDKGPAGDLARSQKDMAEALEAAKKTKSSEPSTPIEHGTGTRPTIKILSTGSEPRRELRTHFVKGTKEHLVLTTNQSITSNGMPAGSIPTTKIAMDVEIIDIDTNGDAKYQFTILGSEVVGRPGIPAMVITNTQQALDMLKGVSGVSFVDPRGFNRDFSVELPAEMPLQMQAEMADQVSNMGQSAAPFPLDAVGVGAVWEVHQVLEQRGMRIDQVTTFKLVEMKADTGKLTSSVVQSAGRQALPPPQPGMTAEMLELAGSGGGWVKYDLNGLVPQAVTTVTLELRMKASAPGQAAQELALRIQQGSEIGIR